MEFVVKAGDVANPIADAAMDATILDIGEHVGLDDREVDALEIEQVGDVLDRPVAGDRQDAHARRRVVEHRHVGGDPQIGAGLDRW